jgi:hypothetical protein
LRPDEKERAGRDRSRGVVDLGEHQRDVDTAMLGCERREPPPCLPELPLAAGLVPAPGLVPGHRDVDEALEEISLAVGRGAPGVLERLVRFEERAGADQVETARQVVRERL